ncbi:MAG: hypothetical protein Q4F57_08170 [Weeksellaceae bacterium]|nr:hypothetical protein [Weeksellaceae bacterium]
MHRFLQYVCLLSFLIASFPTIYAQDIDEENDLEKVVWQSKDAETSASTHEMLKRSYESQETVYDRSWNNLESKYQNHEFVYDSDKPSLTAWDRLMANFYAWLDSLTSSNNAGNLREFMELMINLIAVVGIGILIFIIVKYLLTYKDKFFFEKKAEKLKNNVSDLHEDIHEIDFLTEIANHEQKSDWRLALRYGFLKILKTLTDKGIIDWDAEKTNQDYYQEIQNTALQSQFLQSIYWFDHVWYGEFPISQEQYLAAKKVFTDTENMRV